MQFFRFQPFKFLVGLALLASGAALLAASSPASTMPVRKTWRIALTTNRGGDSDIYSMSSEGTAVRRLTHTPGWDGVGPWSPNGKKMAFYRNQGGVWVMNADGSGKRDLTPGQGFNGPGGWSPDGRRIDFTTDRDGNNEVYVMNADGSGAHDLLPSPSSQETAADWSPDGRTILFVSDRDGNPEIYAMNADGSNPRNLTNNPGNDGGVGGVSGAWWSPDGSRIAFASTRDTRNKHNPELYVMNADGSDVRRVTRNPGIEAFLSWSPDGTKIAFTRTPSKPRWAFFVMNADGSAVRQVNWSLPAHKG